MSKHHTLGEMNPMPMAAKTQDATGERGEAMVLREYDRKLAEVWGKEEHPHAVAYGWVKTQWDAALTAPAAQEGATVTEYTLGDMEDRDRSHLLVRVRYSGRGKWAVCRLGDVLNRDGEWEWEPLPSSRDDAFFARCRFDSAADAIAAARKVLAASLPRGGADV